MSKLKYYDGTNWKSVNGEIIGTTNEYSSSTTESYSCGYINDLQTYSTTETRVGTWINGKPIYRKVINYGNLPNSSYNQVLHNIDNLSQFTKVEAIAKTQAGYYYPLNMHGTSDMFSNNIVMFRVDDTKIQISTTADYSTQTAIVILEYTKTTD